MIRLFINYYTDKDPIRDAELKECLKKNVENRIIDEIYLISKTDNFDVPDRCTVLIGQRPTYDDFFRLINERVAPDDISIIANSDIFFDKSIGAVAKMSDNDCYALSRWDILDGGKIEHHNVGWSQDVWIFRGQIKKTRPCGFHLGIAGCDNSIAYWLLDAGYNISNPSYHIKSYHLHLSEVRNYDKNDKIPGPYHLVFPTQLIKL